MTSIISRRMILAAPLVALPVLVAARRAGAAEDAVAQLGELEKSSGGRLGVAALDTATGKRFEHRADERFAMCSTFKFLAAAAVLSRVDHGDEKLDRRVTYSSADLVANSPITERHVGDGMTVGRDLPRRHNGQRQHGRQSDAGDPRRARRADCLCPLAGRRDHAARPHRDRAQRGGARRSARHHDACRHAWQFAEDRSRRRVVRGLARRDQGVAARQQDRRQAAQGRPARRAGRSATRPAPANMAQPTTSALSGRRIARPSSSRLTRPSRRYRPPGAMTFSNRSARSSPRRSDRASTSRVGDARRGYCRLNTPA